MPTKQDQLVALCMMLVKVRGVGPIAVRFKAHVAPGDAAQQKSTLRRHHYLNGTHIHTHNRSNFTCDWGFSSSGFLHTITPFPQDLRRTLRTHPRLCGRGALPWFFMVVNWGSPSPKGAHKCLIICWSILYTVSPIYLVGFFESSNQLVGLPTAKQLELDCIALAGFRHWSWNSETLEIHILCLAQGHSRHEDWSMPSIMQYV